jgi:hypothetical protein
MVLESIVNPRNSMTWVGSKADLVGCIVNPRSYNNFTVSVVFIFASRYERRINKLSSI